MEKTAAAGRSPRSRRIATARVWVAVGGSGVGSLLALVLVHQHDTAGATTAVVVALTANAIASLSLALPGIITAIASGRCSLLRERERSTITDACLKSLTPGDAGVLLKILVQGLNGNARTSEEIQGAASPLESLDSRG